MGWDDDRIEKLKTLWLEGLSASQIARALGGVTRNAVIGKVHRLGLAGRASPARSERPRLPMAPFRHLPPKDAPAPIIAQAPLKLGDGCHVTMLTVNDRMCRWPVGDPSDDDFHLCGLAPQLGSPYCEPHTRKAHQPQTVHRMEHVKKI